MMNVYFDLLGISPEDCPPNYYQLLGLRLFETDPHVILTAAERQLSRVGQQRLNPNSEQLLKEIGAAKDCLSQPLSKEAYDRHLREQTNASSLGKPSVRAPQTVTPPVAKIPPVLRFPSPQAKPVSMGANSRPPKKSSVGIFIVLGSLAAMLLLMCGGGVMLITFWSSEMAQNVPAKRTEMEPPVIEIPDQSNQDGSGETELPSLMFDESEEETVSGQNKVNMPLDPDDMEEITVVTSEPDLEVLVRSDDSWEKKVPLKRGYNKLQVRIGDLEVEVLGAAARRCRVEAKLDRGKMNYFEIVTHIQPTGEVIVVSDVGAMVLHVHREHNRDPVIGDTLRIKQGENRFQVRTGKIALVPTRSQAGFEITPDKEVLKADGTIKFQIRHRSLDTPYVLVTGGYSEIKLWDLQSGKEIRSTKSNLHGRFHAGAISPDGRLLVGNPGGGHKARIWDLLTGKELREFSADHSVPGSVIFSPDGKRLATKTWNGNVRIWDPQTGKKIRTLKEPKSAIAYSPNGTWFACGGLEGPIQLLDPNTSKELRVLVNAKESVSTSLVFSPDSQRLAAVLGGGPVKVWNLRGGKNMGKVFTGSYRKANAIAFSPDGRLLAAGGDGDLYVWDVLTGKQAVSFHNSPTGKIHTIAFSPDGKLLVTCNEGREVNIWNLKTGRKFRTLDPAGKFTFLAFAPIKVSELKNLQTKN